MCIRTPNIPVWECFVQAALEVRLPVSQSGLRQGQKDGQGAPSTAPAHSLGQGAFNNCMPIDVAQEAHSNYTLRVIN